MERGVREGMDWPYNEDDYESSKGARSPFDRLLDELVALRMERDQIEAREKEIIKRTQELQPLLKLYFDANPQRQSVEINGYNVKMDRMLFAHAKTEKADGIAALRRAGLGQFVSETYSLSTLSGYIRELAEQVDPGTNVQLPPELEDDFEIAEVFEVKAKKSQKGRKRSAGNKKEEEDTWQKEQMDSLTETTES
jgi:hypothetical protein